jgi:hypothetical protein
MLEAKEAAMAGFGQNTGITREEFIKKVTEWEKT